MPKCAYCQTEIIPGDQTGPLKEPLMHKSCFELDCSEDAGSKLNIYWKKLETVKIQLKNLISSTTPFDLLPQSKMLARKKILEKR